MKGPCRIIPYITLDGQSDVLDFLARLRRFEAKAYAKYEYVRDLITEHGTEVQSSHWTFVGDGYGEIRWRHMKVRYRLYCSEEGKSTIVQYVDVKKKWRAFDNLDKDKCAARRRDYQSPHYDHEARYLRYLAKNPNARNP